MFAIMRRFAFRLLITITTLSAIVLIVTSCTQARQDSLRIATAANVQYAMADLVKAFTAQSGIEAEIVISSSGKLSTQIAQGAPYDIFVSADMRYPMHLYSNGYATDEPRMYAQGEIVIWSTSEAKPTFEQMLADAVDHVAMPNPKTAPYGDLAMTALENAGILEAISDKLVFGENVGQVNQFVVSGAAEIGITAKSMVMSSRLKGKGKWTPISEDLYTPISQGLIMVDRELEFRKDALQFFDFIISETAREILAENGYKLPEA